ncbi:hypothetical protein CcNV_057 [Crangon crangon nudivirus]|uniref:IBR domain-containing protein n=1 Tax=Crangon crangon nudivirus TaxID=2880838 RepID=A0AAE9BZ21_9VIRU|nr:hypothetical protein QKT25_gp058 [Crangon crangon nudivirus]UBZ25542.1 hypothetical protein CcNV_057 [Crangon crangon nudivirus]
MASIARLLDKRILPEVSQSMLRDSYYFKNLNDRDLDYHNYDIVAHYMDSFNFKVVEDCRQQLLHIADMNYMTGQRLHLGLVIDCTAEPWNGGYREELLKFVNRLKTPYWAFGVILSIVLYSDINPQRPEDLFMKAYINIDLDSATKLIRSLNTEAHNDDTPNLYISRSSDGRCSLLAIKYLQKCHRLMNMNIPLLIENVTTSDRRDHYGYMMQEYLELQMAGGHSAILTRPYMETGVVSLCDRTCIESYAVRMLGMATTGYTDDGTDLEENEDIFIVHLIFKRPDPMPHKLYSLDKKKNLVAANIWRFNSLAPTMIHYLYILNLRSPLTKKGLDVCQRYTDNMNATTSVRERKFLQATMTLHYHRYEANCYPHATTLNKKDDAQSYLERRITYAIGDEVLARFMKTLKAKSVMHAGIHVIYYAVCKKHLRTKQTIAQYMKDKIPIVLALDNHYNELYCNFTDPCIDCRTHTANTTNVIYVTVNKTMPVVAPPTTMTTYEDLYNLHLLVLSLSIATELPSADLSPSEYRTVPLICVDSDAAVLPLTELFNHWKLVAGSRLAEMFKMFLNHFGPFAFDKIPFNKYVILFDKRTLTLRPSLFYQPSHLSFFRKILPEQAYLEYIDRGFLVNMTAAFWTQCRIRNHPTYRKIDKLWPAYQKWCETCNTNHALMYYLDTQGLGEPNDMLNNMYQTVEPYRKKLRSHKPMPNNRSIWVNSLTPLDTLHPNARCMTSIYHQEPSARHGHYFFKCETCCVWYYVAKYMPKLIDGTSAPKCPLCSSRAYNELSMTTTCSIHGKMWWGMYHYNVTPVSGCIFCPHNYTEHSIPVNAKKPTHKPLYKLIDNVDVLTILGCSYAPNYHLLKSRDIGQLKDKISREVTSLYEIFDYMGLLKVLNTTMPLYNPNTPLIETLTCGVTNVKIPHYIIKKIMAEKVAMDVTIEEFTTNLVTCTLQCTLCDNKDNLMMKRFCVDGCSAQYCHGCFFGILRSKIRQLLSDTHYIPVSEWLQLKCLHCTRPNPWLPYIHNIKPSPVESNLLEQCLDTIGEFDRVTSAGKAIKTLYTRVLKKDRITLDQIPVLKYCKRCNMMYGVPLPPPRDCANLIDVDEDMPYRCAACLVAIKEIEIKRGIVKEKPLLELQGDEVAKILNFERHVDIEKLFRENNNTVIVHDVRLSNTGTYRSLTIEQFQALWERTLGKREYLDQIPDQRKCPRCGVFISKVANCAWMVCIMCQQQFCWVCVSPTHTPGEVVPYCNGHAVLVPGSCLFPINGRVTLTTLYEYDAEHYNVDDVNSSLLVPIRMKRFARERELRIILGEPLPNFRHEGGGV